jgi:arginyl-tRNA synthetase
MFQAEQQIIEQHIRQYCAKSDLPDPGAISWTPLPFSGEWGISTNFFPLAAVQARRIKETTGQGTNVPQLAQEIASGIAAALGQLAGFSHTEAVRGYLNLYFPTSDYARRIVDEVLLRGIDFGRHAPKNETVMVEYAQPNMLHSFHIGHFRNAILGEVLARLVQFYGFNTIRASYPGDIGLGVITVLWAYDRFYKGQEPEGIHERGQWLLRIYVDATKKLDPKENETPEEKALRESYEAERREMLRKWDTNDPYVRQLWQTLREWSLEELHDILRMLDIKIDVWFYESEVDVPSKLIVDELIARGIADDERPQGGAVIVKIDEKLGLTKEKYRSNVILRSDGSRPLPSSSCGASRKPKNASTWAMALSAFRKAPCQPGAAGWCCSKT